MEITPLREWAARRNPRKAALWMWALFSAYVIARSWVSEDAYITFRVVDNFFRGYGLRWNVSERVQAYTHPLWLLLHIPLRVFIPNLFIVSIILSSLCTCGAIWLALRTMPRSPAFTAALLFLPMMASKCYFDFTTGGLENALFYLLYAAFGFVLLHLPGHSRFWFYLSLASGLMLLNRLDTMLFIAPVLAWLAATRWRDIRWGQVWLGAAPLLAWFAFAFFYYGFFLPNTKYAKLDTNIDPATYINEGWHYFRHLVGMDTASALLLLSLPVLALPAMRAGRPLRNPLVMQPALLALGVWLYGLYIINIGGDYMIGRFWALPVWAAIWCLYVFLPPVPAQKLGLVALALALASPVALAPLRDKFPELTVHKWRMDDARHVFGGNTLLHGFWPPKLNTQANHKFVGWGKNIAKVPPPHAEKAHYIGMVGYYAGPQAHLIDEVALADALLSHLPVPPHRPFYIGHFYRAIPDGYLEAVRTGDLSKMDPSLRQYYQKLKVLISEPLWSWSRIKTIVEFNLGAYDRWKYEFLHCNVWA